MYLVDGVITHTSIVFPTSTNALNFKLLVHLAVFLLMENLSTPEQLSGLILQNANFCNFIYSRVVYTFVSNIKINLYVKLTESHLHIFQSVVWHKICFRTEKTKEYRTDYIAGKSFMDQ